MPNFKAKEINLPPLPYYNKRLSFYWVHTQGNVRYLYASYIKDQFFIKIIEKNGEFIIKGDKVAKPTSLACLQAGLIELTKFCKGVSSKAIGLAKDASFLPPAIMATSVWDLENKALLKVKDKFVFEKVYIEIGFGSGRHLLHLAKSEPSTLVIGFEIFDPALLQVSKLASELKNIMICKLDARVVFSLLKSKLADKVFLHFPVPWDKQAKRRVISPAFIKQLFRVLKPNGSFELRTDSKMYLEYTLACLKEEGVLDPSVFTNVAPCISSKYEDRWVRQEKDIYDLIAINKNSNHAKSKASKQKIYLPSLKKEQLLAVINSYKNSIYKSKSFFIHFEELFIRRGCEFYIKVSLGAYDTPFHGYIRLGIAQRAFMFKKPLNTEANYKASVKLREILRYNLFDELKPTKVSK